MQRQFLLLSLYLPAVFGSLLENTSSSQARLENLENLLRHRFNASRRHDANITAKYVVRDFVRDSFEQYGLDVVMHDFPTRKPEFTGTNVIGILNGQRAGTPKDRLVLLGAHYDTADSTPGVDDNGSGMALLLETARALTSQCQPEYTILFVAFDYSENTLSWAGDPCYWDVPCGSQRFVEDWLFSFLSQRGYPVFQGAYIADTVMNWDNGIDTQAFSGTFSILFEDTYKRIQNNSFRGDFLFTYSREQDSVLVDAFTAHYNAQDGANFRIESLTLPIVDQPTAVDKRLYRAQLNSDHHNFWRTGVSFNAVQLTDSANFRGDMQLCHHRGCDDVTQITPQKLTFLTKITKSVVDTLANLSNITYHCRVPPTEKPDRAKERTTKAPKVSNPAKAVSSANGMTSRTINFVLTICVTIAHVITRLTLER
ncbi:uncharacterized protein YfbL-like isoform X2 [Ptychodera flava]|uniref:uncharacterized protein YfbL-like isoform X2 n=1 Tax=Ptychodera flava TaxID=63121 RepID=UPI00396AA5DD